MKRAFLFGRSSRTLRFLLCCLLFWFSLSLLHFPFPLSRCERAGQVGARRERSLALARSLARSFSLVLSSSAAMAEAALLLRPEPLEPALDEEPPYFFRRIGEAAFAQLDGDESSTPASSSSFSSARARPSLASVPAAGIVAYSSGARESLTGRWKRRRERGRGREKRERERA